MRISLHRIAAVDAPRRLIGQTRKANDQKKGRAPLLERAPFQIERLSSSGDGSLAAAGSDADHAEAGNHHRPGDGFGDCRHGPGNLG